VSAAVAEVALTEHEPRRRAFVEHVMGMPVSLHVRGAVEGRDLEAGVEQAYAHLRKVDSVLSMWRPDSDLQRSLRGELPTRSQHRWLQEVRELCTVAERTTGGLFSALATPDGSYDPTGLVKGWAVEGASEHLRHVPGISFCLNAGGDLVAGAGTGARASTWRIGIEDPRGSSRVAATVDLTTGGLATSGSAARGAHVRDPRTGTGVARAGSATVWGPSLLWADVWATALFVDPREGEARLRAQATAYRSLVL
jgi:thiamine biosynthesis lipoprotein